MLIKKKQSPLTAFRPGFFNLGSVNPLGVHECVLRGTQTRRQPIKSASFHPLIRAIIIGVARKGPWPP